MGFIETQNVTFSYGTGESEAPNNVLTDITMKIEKGEFVALLGHNGSGKSTLAKHFNAMLLPSGGKVYVDSMDTLDESLKYQIRRKAGLVLQNPDNQLVASIVEEDVAFGPENLGVPSEEIRVRVDEALKPVQHLRGKKKAFLSITAVQKVQIQFFFCHLSHQLCEQFPFRHFVILDLFFSALFRYLPGMYPVSQQHVSQYVNITIPAEFGIHSIILSIYKMLVIRYMVHPQ